MPLAMSQLTEHYETIEMGKNKKNSTSEKNPTIVDNGGICVLKITFKLCSFSVIPDVAPNKKQLLMIL